MGKPVGRDKARAVFVALAVAVLASRAADADDDTERWRLGASVPWVPYITTSRV